MSVAESRPMPWAKDAPSGPETLVAREWLVTNGLGGYAAGTVAGVNTRRFHGVLVAALPSPLGRVMMLNHVVEELVTPDGSVLRLGGDELEGKLDLAGASAFAGFRLEHGLPVWRYEAGGFALEKSLALPHLQNTVFLRYRLLAGPGTVRLRVRPSLHFRGHESRVDEPLTKPYRVRALGRRFEVQGDPELPPLRLLVWGEDSSFLLDGGRFRTIFYRTEHARGYDARGTLWSPGYLRAELPPGGEAALCASSEPWEVLTAMDPEGAFAVEHARRERLVSQAHPAARTGVGAQLVLAADQFVITPNMRVLDAARTRAAGDDIRSIIAGYHWFTDWGRDTMISLEGLCLDTGRAAEAGCIIRMFARHLRDGLIPNFFPEGRQEGVYHTADATLWFFHAVSRYLERTGDWPTVSALLPVFEEIVRRHVEGTRFGIGVDPADGLLRQGEDGYQLTWMDAKVGDWVVTPRRGKPVEINALWYNALKNLELWQLRGGRGPASAQTGQLADRARISFNERFWNEEAGGLYDVLDGDPAEKALLRPNQLLAVSLPHPVLDPQRWEPVVELCRRELLTPVGLRSLGRGAPNYKPRYDGDLRSRDAAYHQGTVWSWLIGPFVDAWLRLHPGDKAGARAFLEGFVPHLQEGAAGSISEIFDAEPPFMPRGCVAQAWGVAELLRCWVNTAEPNGHNG